MGSDALRIGPNSGRIAVTGNNFSDSYIGGGQVKRTAADQLAAGMFLAGTSEIAVVGNLFSSVRPKALTLKGAESKRVNFSGNVLTDVNSDQKKLRDSLVGSNLEALP